ncbi:MAG: tRNA pseudouridine(55) synthase TruB [Nitrospirae bacterium CG2_30_70_394]|nr:MAG: tRNA pseudouridine(55) synthase TruB [Nitrospirae bacterium CG2_30_70_394]
MVVVDKPRGITSHAAVEVVRRITHIERVGHVGTLDPAARGVLPLLVGKATRLSRFATGWQKEYHATLRLGEARDTQDLDGEVIFRGATSHLTEGAIRDALGHFEGEIEQIPPMYSAKKVGGVPLYKLARKGKEVERAAKRVRVYRLVALAIRPGDPFWEVDFELRCSSGTFVRTICHDVGERLGCGGVLATLVRAAAGPFTIADALSLDEVEARWQAGGAAAVLRPVADCFSPSQRVVVNSAGHAKLRNGQTITLADITPPTAETIAEPALLYSPGGTLLAVARPLGEPVWGFRPTAVLA